MCSMNMLQSIYSISSKNMLNERSMHKYHILYDAIYMSVQNRLIHRDRKYISGFQGLRGKNGSVC